VDWVKHTLLFWAAVFWTILGVFAGVTLKVFAMFVVAAGSLVLAAGVRVGDDDLVLLGLGLFVAGALCAAESMLRQRLAKLQLARGTQGRTPPGMP